MLPHIVEVTVNRIGGTLSGVAGTYNRSDLMDERKEALEHWATQPRDTTQGIKRPTSSFSCIFAEVNLYSYDVSKR